MLQKDKIKSIAALLMVGAIGITYYFAEKDSIALKIVSGGCLAAWIVVMLITNKNSNK